MTNPQKLAVIVAAGGSGERFGDAGGKQLTRVLGRPLLSWTLEALIGPPVDSIVVVCHPMRVEEYERTAIAPLGSVASIQAVAGGDTRQDSVARGLAVIPEWVDYVGVHDGARPLVTLDMLSSAVALLEQTGADGVVAGHPCYDTLKIVEGTRVAETPDRSRYWIAQTPQVFRRSVLEQAYQKASDDNFLATDDAGLVEHLGGLVEMVQVARDNIKVTTAQDVRFVEAVLTNRLEGAPS